MLTLLIKVMVYFQRNQTLTAGNSCVASVSARCGLYAKSADVLEASNYGQALGKSDDDDHTNSVVAVRGSNGGNLSRQS